MMTIEGNKMTEEKKVVIITDYSPLTENLIDWLKSSHPQVIIINGDNPESDFNLKCLDPDLIILDTGFISNRETKLMNIIKTDLPNTKILILTFSHTDKYQSYMLQTGLQGKIVEWQNYQKLPFHINTLLTKNKFSKSMPIKQ